MKNDIIFLGVLCLVRVVRLCGLGADLEIIGLHVAESAAVAARLQRLGLGYNDVVHR